MQAQAVTQLRDLLVSQTELTALGFGGQDQRRYILSDGRKHPQLGPVAAALVVAGIWILTKTGEWIFGKILDNTIKPPVTDWTKSPRFVRKEIKKGPCVAKRRVVTEYIYVKNPSGVLFTTYYEDCGEACPKNGAGGGGNNNSAAASLAHALGATNGEGLITATSRARPLASGGSCPNPPPEECPAIGNPNNNGGGSGGGSCGSSGGSIDPNDKFGAAGDGTASHWLRQTMPLPYQIAFENQPTATLPAAEVVVTDQLDPTKLDLSTLTLGNIAWGPYRIDVPAGLNSYSTIFPINTAMSVRVAGSLNPTTGLLKWTFTTLDPVTKLPPSDPTLGFLPPNKNGTEGQGYVNFTVSPKAGLGDGTRWENFASIVFDRNAAILTPTWVNTLDTTAPFSRVATVAQKATGTDLDVTWSGTDAGSGVRRYSVFVSDNGGAFTAWQSNVTSSSATYSGGVIGHTYGFNVVATDGAGNVESTRLTADASVLVRDTTVVPPVVTPPASGGGGGCSIASGGDQRDGSLPLLLAAAGVVLVWRRRFAAQTAWR